MEKREKERERKGIRESKRGRSDLDSSPIHLLSDLLAAAATTPSDQRDLFLLPPPPISVHLFSMAKEGCCWSIS